MRIAMSAVVIIGWFNLPGMCASGTFLPASPLGFHWFAPAGLFVSSHSWPNRVSK